MTARTVCLVGVFLSIASLTRPVHACSCAPTELEEAFWSTGVIFEGQVTDVTGTVADFKVEKTWKGRIRAAAKVSTAASGSMCGLGFKKGQRWIIFAYAYSSGMLGSGMCTWSRPVSDESRLRDALYRLADRPPPPLLLLVARNRVAHGDVDAAMGLFRKVAEDSGVVRLYRERARRAAEQLGPIAKLRSAALRAAESAPLDEAVRLLEQAEKRQGPSTRRSRSNLLAEPTIVVQAPHERARCLITSRALTVGFAALERGDVESAFRMQRIVRQFTPNSLVMVSPIEQPVMQRAQELHDEAVELRDSAPLEAIARWGVIVRNLPSSFWGPYRPAHKELRQLGRELLDAAVTGYAADPDGSTAIWRVLFESTPDDWSIHLSARDHLERVKAPDLPPRPGPALR